MTDEKITIKSTRDLARRVFDEVRQLDIHKDTASDDRGARWHADLWDMASTRTKLRIAESLTTREMYFYLQGFLEGYCFDETYGLNTQNRSRS